MDDLLAYIFFVNLLSIAFYEVYISHHVKAWVERRNRDDG